MLGGANEHLLPVPVGPAVDLRIPHGVEDGSEHGGAQVSQVVNQRYPSVWPTTRIRIPFSKNRCARPKGRAHAWLVFYLSVMVTVSILPVNSLVERS